MATTTKINFHKAAQRHFDDAELLLEHQRRANAGHLYGFAAECGIKAFLVFRGLIETDTDGDIPNKRHNLRVHAGQLNQMINTMISLSDGRLTSQLLALIPNISDFNNWKVEHRYHDESKLPLTSINQWQIAAKQVMIMLEQANIDGVIQ